MNIYSPTISGSLTISGSIITTGGGLPLTGSLVSSGSFTSIGNTTVSGSLLVSGSITTNSTITAQTLVVQTITSSVSYITGSTQFGSLSSNTHQFTGSMYVTGALAIGSGSFPQIFAVKISGSAYNGANVWFQDASATDGMSFGGNGANSYKTINTYGGALYLNYNSQNGVNMFGNVGIGTSTIDTSGGLYTCLTIDSSTYSRFSLQSSGVAKGRFQFDATNVSLGSTATGGKLQLFTLGAYAMEFSTNDTLRMTITSAGNVGIGIVPQTWSTVYKSLQVGNASLLCDASSNTYTGTNTYIGSDAQWKYISNLPASIMGLETNSFVFYNAASGTTGNNISWTERFRITSAGLVSINGLAASTNYKLGVTGAAYIEGTNSKGIFFTDQASHSSIVGLNSAISAYNSLELRGSGTDGQLYLITSGNVSIKTKTDFGYALNLNGQPGANGYTAWTNWSDSRLKENVTNLEVTNVLNKICAIRPVTYNYNELSGFDEATRARRISGFIAQELMEVFPDMVGTITKDDTEYYDTNLSNLNLYLVKAIQELKSQNDALQSRIETLEQK